jgi:tRNA modification GTPase
MTNDRDTIFALSSGALPAAIGVVRVSGPRARHCVEALARRCPEPRQATLVRLRSPGSDRVLDEALVLWFPGPRSETGEDMAELQLHGGRAVVAAVLRTLGQIPRCRPADPGEFTRRAFENGRLDLTAVEGLADLIGAETEAQRQQAFRQLKGALGQRAATWRQRLVESIALVEAGIDFSDEGDVPDTLLVPALDVARELRAEIVAALSDGRRGERLRDGLVIAIAGPPNAGKSSLLNRIARREAAIVSPYAGTTRDVIEVHLDLEGYPVTLLDTAGIRETSDPVEWEGVRRARERAQSADLVLWVVDAAQDGDAAAADGNPAWIVRNKIDLTEGEMREGVETGRSFRISALTGTGVDELLDALAAHASGVFSGAEATLVTRERHRRALEGAATALGRALAEGRAGREDIVAEDLRLAARDLGRLIGTVDVEDVLDVIFRDFCIGK